MAFGGLEGYAIFEACFKYKPKDEKEIELKVGDQCWVQNPVQNPQGWLIGLNKRSNAYGQFPGTYCRMLDLDASPSLPPLPPKPDPKRMICYFILL